MGDSDRTCSAVGMAGFYPGRSDTELTGAYGLGIDNLLSAQVVTADGQSQPQTPKNIPIRFGTTRGRQLWRCRSWSIACIHSRPCYLGCCSIRKKEEPLRRLNDFMAIPDELTILFVHSDARGRDSSSLTALLW